VAREFFSPCCGRPAHQSYVLVSHPLFWGPVWGKIFFSPPQKYPPPKRGGLPTPPFFGGGEKTHKKHWCGGGDPTTQNICGGFLTTPPRPRNVPLRGGHFFSPRGFSRVFKKGKFPQKGPPF